MPTTDPYGTWNELGTVFPVHSQWVYCPSRTEEFNATFRLTFYGDVERANSFLWFRTEFDINGTRLVQQAIRVYPKFERQIIEYPMNSEIVRAGTTTRIVGVQKKHRWQKYVGYTPDTNYAVLVEELW